MAILKKQSFPSLRGVFSPDSLSLSTFHLANYTCISNTAVIQSWKQVILSPSCNTLKQILRTVLLNELFLRKKRKKCMWSRLLHNFLRNFTFTADTFREKGETADRSCTIEHTVSGNPSKHDTAFPEQSRGLSLDSEHHKWICILYGFQRLNKTLATDEHNCLLLLLLSAVSVNCIVTRNLKQVNHTAVVTRAVVYFRNTNNHRCLGGWVCYRLSSPPDVPSFLRRPSSSQANVS